MSDEPALLVVDTATREAVVALADTDGTILEDVRWTAGYRHGEELLPRVTEVLGRRQVALGDLVAIVVGTGPGAFTGLRVGIATAKGLAHAAGLRIVGVSTGQALIDAAGSAPGDATARDSAAASEPRIAVLLPAGPADRVLCRRDEAARLLPGGEEPDARPGERIVALDLDDRAPSDALAAGHAARAGLATALARRGAARLATHGPDDLATLVPDYVTLPRGVDRPVAEGVVRVAAGS